MQPLDADDTIPPSEGDKTDPGGDAQPTVIDLASEHLEDDEETRVSTAP